LSSNKSNYILSTIRLQTLNFFTTSRDKWKQKHKEKQSIIKYLKIKIRDLSKSRNYWKNKAQYLDGELKKNEKIAKTTKKINHV
jgi:hypothetical protein